MQNTKDSFFIAVRDRLAVFNPSRTILIQGVSRPAVLVIENEISAAAPHEPDVFYIRWGVSTSASGTERLEQPLIKTSCEISYLTEGTDDLSSQDRGRALATLDGELRSITTPARASLKDFTQSPPVDLGAAVFWTRPVLGEIAQDGRRLMRTAKLDVFSFAEVNF
jgi:hypothetical protein